jgi:mannose-6-phosphate isomerase-like protein (cupin superfamily)
VSRPDPSRSPAQVRSPDEAAEYLTDEGCFILESWNRGEDPAVSIARARVEPGVATRLHLLSGIVERYLILSGEGAVEIDGAAPVPVGAGDVVYIPEGASQRIRNSGAVDLVFLAICTPRFRPAAYADIDPAPRA